MSSHFMPNSNRVLVQEQLVIAIREHLKITILEQFPVTIRQHCQVTIGEHFLFGIRKHTVRPWLRRVTFDSMFVAV